MPAKSELSKREKKALITQVIIRFSLLALITTLFVLLPAGTFNYWQAYVFFAVLTISLIFTVVYFLKYDPALLQRRLRIKEKEKQQLRIQYLSSAVIFSGFILSGLDRRFGWSEVPLYIVISADLLVLTGYLLIFFVFKQNSYASRVVEVTPDQKLISSGLYGIVRHPMYLGILIMYIPSPLALGSYCGLIPFALLPVFLVLRILNEEKVLSEELEGYREYRKKVRYRLVPGVW